MGSAVLKERHALDEQEVQLERRKAELRRRKEQLGLHAQIAAVNARLAVLRAAEVEEEGLTEYSVPKCKTEKGTTDHPPSEYQPTRQPFPLIPKEIVKTSNGHSTWNFTCIEW